MSRGGHDSLGEHHRIQQTIADTKRADFAETLTNATDREKKANETKRSWHDLVLGVKKRYSELKEILIARTNKTAEKVADTYTEKYFAERDPKTGETPQTMMRKFSRACEAAYESVGVQAAVELGIRAALHPLEFSAQMAMKQFGVDLAVRQAEYTATSKKYDAYGGAKEIKTQAVEFANTVRRQFERLQAQQAELPGGTPEEREHFRQSKIAEGVSYAHDVLSRFAGIDEHAKQRIITDLHTHLDTVVYDSHKPSVLKKWESVRSQYVNDIQHIVTRHIDLYQKEQSRNVALLTAASRWVTLGAETYIVQRGLSASRALSENYTKELTALPAEQRTGIERMRAFGRATSEGLVQLTGFDRYRNLRKESTRVDEIVQALLPEEDGELMEDADVNEIVDDMMHRYRVQLEERGLDRSWVQKNIQEISGYEKNRRKALVELIQYRIEGLHRQYVKAAVAHAEHVYDQYNANITAVNMLAHIDTAVNEGARIRESIGVTLEQLSQETATISIPTSDLQMLTSVNEPQYHAVAAIVQDVQHAAAQLHAEAVTLQDYSLPDADSAEMPMGPEIAPEDVAVAAEVHRVVKGETLWGIATAHLEAYRVRENDPKMTVHDVLQVISAENHIPVQGVLQIDQELQLAPLTPEMLQQADEKARGINQYENTAQQIDYTQLAKQADAGEDVEGIVEHVGRNNLADLPEGSYTIVVGERYTASGQRMPIHYSDQFIVTVVDAQDIRVAPINQPQQTMTLNDFLVVHQDPIIRVFSESEGVSVEQEQLRPHEWSQKNQALLKYLQDHPITVEEREGAYCARDVAGRYNLFGDQLAADVGMSFRDREGNISGVVAHAPLVVSAIEANGGQLTTSLANYFEVETSERRVLPLERLSSENPEYRAAVSNWIHEARSPLSVATFFYDHTKIQPEIVANMRYGGEPNSHVVLMLGDKDISFSPHKEMSLENAIEKQLGLSQQDMDERGWMFETLGVEVNGVQVTSQQEWKALTIQPTDHVVIHDVALNHRYHEDRADTLVGLLVNDGALTPVSVVQPNAELLNDALAYRGNGADYAIETFHQVQAGESFAAILAAENYPRDLWTAATFALQAQGVDPAHIRPGELLPLFNPTELRAHIDDVYSFEERRRMSTDAEVIHIVRPGETMSELAGSLFERGRYSTSEWLHIQQRLADMASAQSGIAQQTIEMPGNEYVEPYQMTQYTMQADSQLHFSREDLATIEERVVADRLNHRTYVPDVLPMYTAEGIVEKQIPADIQRAIDHTVNAHPDYEEKGIREGLMLVYVNEGMRETVEKNAFSRLVEEMDTEIIQPKLSYLEVATHAFDSAAGSQFSAAYASARDQVIGISEYMTSRQMLKDVAWWVHDTPEARAILDAAIAEGKSGSVRTAVVGVVSSELGYTASIERVDDTIGEWTDAQVDKIVRTMETVRDVSSAGVFQVRANNFISDDGKWNVTDSLLGRHFDTQEQLEIALRADTQLNTEAAAALLYQNRLALETYTQAAHDPMEHDEKALLLAEVNSYNGGPYKTLLGGLQYRMMELARAEGVVLPIEKASGRDTAQTREAFVALCTGLAERGVITVTSEQVQADAALLGEHTIGFLHSESYVALQEASQRVTGESMSLLPTMEMLGSSDVTYGNYAFLANRGSAYEAIEDYSSRVRVALGDAVVSGYARRDSTGSESERTGG